MNQEKSFISLFQISGGKGLLAGNQLGKTVFQELQNRVDAAPGVAIFTISLEGIEATDASFPRESVVSLVKLLRGERGFVLEGFSSTDLIDNWDYAAKAKEQSILVRQKDQEYRVIGPDLSQGTKDLLDFVLKEGVVTTSKVARHFDITVQNASAKMKRLHQAGLVLGSKENAETGGLEYIYTAIGTSD